MYDQEKAAEAWVSYARSLEPDAMVGSAIAAGGAGPIFDALDYKLFSWPGHGVPETASFQYVEKEWMLPEEYDDLIDDPTDYMLRTYIPRTNGALAGLAKLDVSLRDGPALRGGLLGSELGGPRASGGASRSCMEAGRQAAAWAEFSIGLDMRLVSEGFPAHPGLVTWAPFDFLGDTLRGTRGIVTDLYRYPEKVLAACDRLLPVLLKDVTRKAAPFVPPTVFIPLHKGADGFMNDEQFRTFYWPTLRKMCLGLIEQGLVPYLFAEGSYNSRLEIIRDLPAGRTVWHFDQTDMAQGQGSAGRHRLHRRERAAFPAAARDRRRGDGLLPQAHRRGEGQGWLHPGRWSRGRHGQGGELQGHDPGGEDLRGVLSQRIVPAGTHDQRTRRIRGAHMTKKIIGLSCGRKNGNSEHFLKAALMAAEEEGVQSEIIRAMDLKVLPCNGCWACLKTGRCAKDDVDWILEQTLLGDTAVIVSAPVYHLRSNSYLMIIAEKTNHLFSRKPDIFERRRVGAAISWAAPATTAGPAWDSFDQPLPAALHHPGGPGADGPLRGSGGGAHSGQRGGRSSARGSWARTWPGTATFPSRSGSTWARRPASLARSATAT